MKVESMYFSMTEPAPRNFNSELSAGLGLKLVNLLASQMKGEFRIADGDASAFEVALPYLN
jgi:two-component sensor histidine kinase